VGTLSVEMIDFRRFSIDPQSDTYFSRNVANLYHFGTVLYTEDSI